MYTSSRFLSHALASALFAFLFALFAFLAVVPARPSFTALAASTASFLVAFVLIPRVSTCGDTRRTLGF